MLGQHRPRPALDVLKAAMAAARVAVTCGNVSDHIVLRADSSSWLHYWKWAEVC